MFKKHIKFGPRTATPLLPDRVAGAMNFPKGVDLSNTSVCILELGGMFNPADIVNYCNRFGYKHPPLFNVEVAGAVESNNEADAEVSLDICVVAGAAQGTKITVVFAPNTNAGFVAGIQECINLSPDAISISWGAPLEFWDSGSLSAMDSILLKAKNTGIPVFCAAGDNGSSDGTNKIQSDYPACSPYVIACGGTKLELAADGSRSSEVVWSLSGDGSGTGGGIASNYPTPAYQSKLKGFAGGRKEPDVAGNADPSTGYVIEIDGQNGQVGGTSAVAPLYAALACIVNASLGKKGSFDWHEELYANPECFFDVVVGNNGAYSAQPGFDCCTGLGILDAGAFISILKGKQAQPVPQQPVSIPPQKVTVWHRVKQWFISKLKFFKKK